MAKGILLDQIPKGSSQDNSIPLIVRPLGTSLLYTPRLISWYNVPGATNYSVQVQGDNFAWERFTKNHEIVYPSNVPLMRPGNTYKVTVFAYANITPLTASTRLYNVLPSDSQKLVSSKLKIIYRYALSEDERLYQDLKSVYLLNGLEEELASSLEKRISLGSKDYNIYKLLSDQFLNNGYISIAETVMNKIKRN